MLCHTLAKQLLREMATDLVTVAALFHWSDLVYHLSFSYNLLYFVLQK